jgi:glycosyltransferase involved in cell wall biosynthesis
MTDARKIGSISLFLPAFNDEATIGRLVRDSSALLESLTDDYEIIVVNDGSVDGTGPALDDLAQELPKLQVVHHDRNEGYGRALRSGFQHAGKDLIFYTDGDGQYDVRELATLLPLMTDAVDVVNGYKTSRADTWRRKASGAVYNWLAQLLFQIPIRDVDCDFRLLRRSAVKRIELGTSSGAICVEMVHRLHAAGSVFAEAPVHHYQRRHGRSQFFTAGRVARTVLDFGLLWWKLVAMRRFAASPHYPINTVERPKPLRRVRGLVQKSSRAQSL